MRNEEYKNRRRKSLIARTKRDKDHTFYEKKDPGARDKPRPRVKYKPREVDYDYEED